MIEFMNIENITWETESKKPLVGDGHQQATASMCRACKAQIDLMIEAVKKGDDPIKRLEAANQWLAMVLYSCNMNNFIDITHGRP